MSVFSETSADRASLDVGTGGSHPGRGGGDRVAFSIVIPAYNEERAIAPLLDRVLSEVARIEQHAAGGGRCEVLVVNDGSTDRTADIVAQRGAVTLVNCARNRGYGAALKTGFQRAAGDAIGFLDADGTYPPEYLHVLYDALHTSAADMVVGSRMMGAQSRMPAVRKLGNWLFARLIGWSGTHHISDGGSGMRVFRRAVLPRLFPLSDGLDFIVAMSARAIHEDLAVMEVAIPYAERVGESKLRVLSDGARFLRTIVTVALEYNPLKFFLLAGAVLLGWALFLSLPAVWYYITVRRVEDTEIYRLFTVMVLLVSGVETVYFGLLVTRVLALTENPARRRKGVGRVASFLLDRRVFQLSIRAGVTLILAAAVLNYRTIYQYVMTRQIYMHWSYMFTGATLVLVGVQLIMGGALSKILQEVTEREALRRSTAQNDGASPNPDR